MQTYRFFEAVKFPELKINEVKKTVVNLTLPGFTDPAETKIKLINTDYCGFEYFEVSHKMIINDNGVAFDFQDGKQIKIEFTNFLKSFTVKAFLERKNNYVLFSEVPNVVQNLYKTLKDNLDTCTDLKEYKLDLDQVTGLVIDFLNVWLKGVSPRVKSFALFGSDIINEPIYTNAIVGGAHLSSITIPYKGISVQMNSKAGVSSKQKFIDIKTELSLLKDIKAEIIDKIRI